MRKFGLIGYPLGHSFSQSFFATKFLKDGITDASYTNFPIEDITGITSLLKEIPDLKGLNVTIPYKEKVLPYLDEYNTVVKDTGACNCIKINNGKLSGYNTDVTGFQRSLESKRYSHHQKALILGEGGAAKAVAYVLHKLSIDFLYVVRKGELNSSKIYYEQLTPSVIRDHLLIINSTPLGMYPNTEQFPPIDYTALTNQHYLFDLIYNPEMTRFLEYGKQKGAITQNGLDMLIIQAEESWKIWNNLD